MLLDYLVFVRELPKSFSEIGAMLPSSPALAKVMVDPVTVVPGPRRILEVGPGTGPFTREILGLMRDGDTFVICEINPRFMARLKNSLCNDPNFLRHAERVIFFEGPVQALKAEKQNEKFDVIVSSLPFVNFTPDVVDGIFMQFSRMLKENGVVTFLQYVGVWKLRELLSSNRTRKRVQAVEDVIAKWAARAKNGGEVRKKVSLLNVPPAMSVQLKFAA